MKSTGNDINLSSIVATRPSVVTTAVRDNEPEKCGYVLVFHVDVFPPVFRRDGISKLRMGSSGQPLGDGGNFVHSFLQAAQRRIVVQRCRAENVLEVLQRHREHEVRPRSLEKGDSCSDSSAGHFFFFFTFACNKDTDARFEERWHFRRLYLDLARFAR